eukprot:SAG31_NODE_281_length_18584_cov_10.762564_19_plen_376_part_00
MPLIKSESSTKSSAKAKTKRSLPPTMRRSENSGYTMASPKIGAMGLPAVKPEFVAVGAAKDVECSHLLEHAQHNFTDGSRLDPPPQKRRKGKTAFAVSAAVVALCVLSVGALRGNSGSLGNSLSTADQKPLAPDLEDEIWTPAGSSAELLKPLEMTIRGEMLKPSVGNNYSCIQVADSIPPSALSGLFRYNISAVDQLSCADLVAVLPDACAAESTEQHWPIRTHCPQTCRSVISYPAQIEVRVPATSIPTDKHSLYPVGARLVLSTPIGRMLSEKFASWLTVYATRTQGTSEAAHQRSRRTALSTGPAVKQAASTVTHVTGLVQELMYVDRIGRGTDGSAFAQCEGSWPSADGRTWFTMARPGKKLLSRFCAHY